MAGEPQRRVAGYGRPGGEQHQCRDCYGGGAGQGSRGGAGRRRFVARHLGCRPPERRIAAVTTAAAPAAAAGAAPLPSSARHSQLLGGMRRRGCVRFILRCQLGMLLQGRGGAWLRRRQPLRRLPLLRPRRRVSTTIAPTIASIPSISHAVASAALTNAPPTAPPTAPAPTPAVSAPAVAELAATAAIDA